MPDDRLFFQCERMARASAARARDLAASTSNPHDRRGFLREAAIHAHTIPGSRYERLLVRE